mmetsp:Transcript_26694/g.79297  ORF Transcript_26694/g.79297 Transcript_26694/m.79297 type:complete len:598 (-) Transcript_26694:1357-3150(-)
MLRAPLAYRKDDLLSWHPVSGSVSDGAPKPLLPLPLLAAASAACSADASDCEDGCILHPESDPGVLTAPGICPNPGPNIPTVSDTCPEPDGCCPTAASSCPESDQESPRGARAGSCPESEMSDGFDEDDKTDPKLPPVDRPRPSLSRVDTASDITAAAAAASDLPLCALTTRRGGPRAAASSTSPAAFMASGAESVAAAPPPANRPSGAEPSRRFCRSSGSSDSSLCHSGRSTPLSFLNAAADSSRATIRHKFMRILDCDFSFRKTYTPPMQRTPWLSGRITKRPDKPCVASSASSCGSTRFFIWYSVRSLIAIGSPASSTDISMVPSADTVIRLSGRPVDADAEATDDAAAARPRPPELGARSPPPAATPGQCPPATLLLPPPSPMNALVKKSSASPLAPPVCVVRAKAWRSLPSLSTQLPPSPPTAPPPLSFPTRPPSASSLLPRPSSISDARALGSELQTPLGESSCTNRSAWDSADETSASRTPMYCAASGNESFKHDPSVCRKTRARSSRLFADSVASWNSSKLMCIDRNISMQYPLRRDAPQYHQQSGHTSASTLPSVTQPSRPPPADHSGSTSTDRSMPCCISDAMSSGS